MSIVYILTNEAMPGLIKIGLTNSTVEQRMITLDNTSVPLPFECYYAARVSDSAKIERALHVGLGDHRVRNSREFFRIDPYRAKAILEVLAIEEVTPGASVFVEPDDLRALQKGMKMVASSEWRVASGNPDWVGYELFASWDVNVQKILDAVKVHVI